MLSVPAVSSFRIYLKMSVETEPIKETVEKEEGPFSKAWQNSDAVLVVEEKELHVHSMILSLASPYFERMFNGNFKESQTKRVTLEGKSFPLIEQLLKIIYPNVETGELVASEMLKGLHQISEEFMVPSVKSAVLKEVLSLSRSYQFYQKDRVVKLWELADYLDCKEAIENCTNKLFQQYDSYTRSLIKSSTVRLEIKNKLKGLRLQEAQRNIESGFQQYVKAMNWKGKHEIRNYGMVKRGMDIIQFMAKDMIDEY
ncbi:kelch-like protein 30 [Clytia hemisphaerica]|uniref:kelch-like protein 30 n=1 Tax=Clytia hemisphaerica TaxID=252671 RepID=UPI0034D6C600